MRIVRHSTLAVLGSLALMAGLHGQAVAPAPVLVVVNAASPNPYGGYLAEILRAEGINSVDVTPLATLNPSILAAAKLVVLSETPLTSPQAGLFSDYVAAGGRLVAMRPDTALAGVLGVTVAGGTTNDGYTLINQAGPGAGLQAVTLPFKGAATHYALAGASSIASLYSSRTAATGLAAVVRFNRTATWSFDLARSTVYTRQGDPLLAGQERDGIAPYRTTDLFYGRIDLERVDVPHADVQMRLFARVVADLLADAMPLPRLWYFPGTAKTMFLLTADAHTTTAAPYSELIAAAESVGARVTMYLPPFVPPPADLPPATLAAWRAAGHEFGLHPVFDGGPLSQVYQTNLDWFTNMLLLAPGATTRHHRVEWAGWVDPAATMRDNGVRMDLSYYPWGPTMFNPTQAQQAHGFVTGSGQPMRFVDATGAVLPVYQQATSLVDEQLIYGPMAEGLSPPAALAVSRQLIDASLAGGYSVIAAQFHVDYYTFGEVRPWADGTMAYAQSVGVPMWTSDHWLRFREARAATQMTNLAWSAGTRRLTFDVAVPAGAEAQGVMLPASFEGRALSLLTLNGAGAAPFMMTVNGQTVQVLLVPSSGGSPRPVVVEYADPSTLPVMNVSDTSAPEGDSGSSIANLQASLSVARAAPVTVTYAVTAGTATAGVDFVQATGMLSFPAGVTTQPIPVTVLGDRVDEPNETVLVVLSNPIGASAGVMTATLTIVDDDEPPVAVADIYGTPFQTSLQVAAPGVLANDLALGVLPLTAQLVQPPAYGTVSLNSDGSFLYVPEPDAGGPDVFTYRAVNSVGAGPAATVTVNVTQPTTVQRPRDMHVFDLAGNLLTLRWTPPRAGPRPVTYLIEGSVLPGQPIATVDVGGPLPVLTLNAPTGSFFVRVRAIADGLISAPSDEIPVHINVPVPPSAPGALLASVNGSVLGLSWQIPYGGGAPLGMVLDVTGSAAASIPLPVSGVALFSGAPSGAYTLSVRALNGAGSSPPSPPVAIGIPASCAGALLPPTHPLFYTVGRTVHGLWEPPASGTAATGYLLDVAGFGLLPMAGRRFSIDAPSGTYSVAVRATNPCGLGPPTAFTTIVVP